MERDHPAPPPSLSSSEIQIMMVPKTGTNVIHRAEAARSSPLRIQSGPGPMVYREEKHSKKWMSWLIPSFVVANIVMFIITMYVNNCPKNSVSCIARFLGRLSFQSYKENHLLGPSSDTLQKLGALDVGKVVHGHQGWRLLTCIWLHAGLFHILANMLSILVIGIRLEQEFGFVKIGCLYVISGFGGSLLSALFIQTNISVGASGAIFGLLGGMLSELITNWTMYSNKVVAFFTLVIIIVVNLAVGILPHVDNFAHIGGFLSGFLLGFVFLIRPQFGWFTQQSVPPGYSSTTLKSKFKAYQRVLWVVSLVLLILGFTIGLILLLRGVDANDYCSWCHYLSCFPTSRWKCKTQPTYCLTTQIGDQLNLTCSSNGKSGAYILPKATGSQIEDLCKELCR